jgi:hypothetical protein
LGAFGVLFGHPGLRVSRRSRSIFPTRANTRYGITAGTRIRSGECGMIKTSLRFLGTRRRILLSGESAA